MWLLNPYRFGTALDANAVAYIAAVEAADGQALEAGVRTAINTFVVGCKADGIWNAIKASCILAGARTLNGALVPLVGTAPTNFNFVSDDYNRKTGLKGNGSNKRLDTSRPNNADPQNSQHLAAYVSEPLSDATALAGSGAAVTGGRTLIWRSGTGYIYASRQNTAFPSVTIPGEPHFVGFSRGASNTTSFRAGLSSATDPTISQAPTSDNISIFAFTAPSPGFFTIARIAFYSTGESLDLALLDARVTTLINAFAAAIP